MMLPAAARPPLQSFLEGPSTVFWVAVVAVNGGHQTLYNAEFLVDNLGQRSQAVGGAGSVGNNVHILSVLVVVYAHYETSGVSLSLAGAEITTFFAPPLMCAWQAFR